MLNCCFPLLLFAFFPGQSITQTNALHHFKNTQKILLDKISVTTIRMIRDIYRAVHSLIIIALCKVIVKKRAIIELP
jgi:hypothetical protein